MTKSEVGERIMKTMGWKEGEGLGKNKSGILECIQIRRREEVVGLGFKNNKGLDADDDYWSQMYNRGIGKEKKSGLNFVKGNSLKSVKAKAQGCLADEELEEDLTSDVSDSEDEEQVKETKKVMVELTPRQRLMMKMKGKLTMFSKGEVLDSQFKNKVVKSELLTKMKTKTKIIKKKVQKSPRIKLNQKFNQFFDKKSLYSKRDHKLFKKFQQILKKSN